MIERVCVMEVEEEMSCTLQSVKIKDGVNRRGERRRMKKRLYPQMRKSCCHTRSKFPTLCEQPNLSLALVANSSYLQIQSIDGDKGGPYDKILHAAYQFVRMVEP